MVFMDERCGAWQVGDNQDAGEVEFRVFLPAGPDPGITSIRVAGDFQHHLGSGDWDFDAGLMLSIEPRQDRRGRFWSVRTPVALPAGFYQYKYGVEFRGVPPRIVTDPCARYGGLRDQNSGVVVGGSRPGDNVVRPLVGGRKPLSDLVVYELMIDDFTAEYRRGRAPLEAVIDRLDDLVALGINAVEFMPWTAWKHPDFDWGYEPFQYFAVEARYADALDAPQEKLSWLKALISACHDRGIHVIMDGVFNHVSHDFPYPQFYRRPADCPFVASSFGGTFTGLQDLDFSEPITGQLVFEVCRYWTDTFGIDGIRFDNTVNFYVPDDRVHGLPDVLDRIATHAADRGEKHFSLTLEHLDASAAQVTNSTSATSFWDNSLHEATFGALRSGRIGPDLLASLNNRRFLAEGKVPTLYLSNHDHSQVAWKAGEHDARGAVGGWWRVQPFLIALFAGTGVPLLHSGQEFGEEHVLPENDEGTGRRVVGRPLRWKFRGDPIGRTLTALHRRLAALRHAHPALRSPFIYPSAWESWQTRFNPVGVGVDVERQLVIFHRWAPVQAGVDNVVVVLNFSDRDQDVEVPFPTTGRWVDELSSFAGDPTWSLDVAGSRASVPVGSHWGRVLCRLNQG